ncbi:hypothetical protein KSP40_PGU018534 [Platanthera guangdongensis]|uniref:Uncharacterized protein n=1 Tax=Platanthera guangdongensis TaxID=2320717 RepID=A0ABR2LGF7_9ASPA
MFEPAEPKLFEDEEYELMLTHQLDGQNHYVCHVNILASSPHGPHSIDQKHFSPIPSAKLLFPGDNMLLPRARLLHRIDLEEAKTQEIAKLQDVLHDMQQQVMEANSMVIKEREASRKAIEEAPPIIKETHVLVQDVEKISSLISEVEHLKQSSSFLQPRQSRVPLVSPYYIVSAEHRARVYSVGYLTSSIKEGFELLLRRLSTLHTSYSVDL